MAKGIVGSGAGFDAPSMGRLGGRGPVPIHNPPAHQLKKAALKVPQLCTQYLVSQPRTTMPRTSLPAPHYCTFPSSCIYLRFDGLLFNKHLHFAVKRCRYSMKYRCDAVHV